MLRAWGLCLTALLGISFSLAYGMADSSFLKDSQWEQGKKFLAEGKAKEAKEAFEALVKRHPKEPDLGQEKVPLPYGLTSRWILSHIFTCIDFGKNF